MTAATSTQGVQLKRAGVLIAEVTSFKGPGTKAPQIDVSSFDSTAMEFISGLKDQGEFTFDLNFVGSNAEQQSLQEDIGSTAVAFTLVLADDTVSPTQAAFSALVTAFELSGAVNQALKASCTLKITGEVTWTYAA